MKDFFFFDLDDGGGAVAAATEAAADGADAGVDGVLLEVFFKRLPMVSEPDSSSDEEESSSESLARSAGS